MVVYHVTGDLLKNEPNGLQNDDTRRQIEDAAKEYNLESVGIGKDISEIAFGEESDSQFSMVSIAYRDGKCNTFYGLTFALGYLAGATNGLVNAKKHLAHKIWSL